MSLSSNKFLALKILNWEDIRGSQKFKIPKYLDLGIEIAKIAIRQKFLVQIPVVVQISRGFPFKVDHPQFFRGASPPNPIS